MTYIYNSKHKKYFRRKLRNNATIPEKILWGELKSKKLGYKFSRQYSICEFVVDFYCPKKRLVIEIDGDTHNSNGAKLYDEFRTKILNSLDIKVMRFSNQEIWNNIDVVVKRIEAELNIVA